MDENQDKKDYEILEELNKKLINFSKQEDKQNLAIDTDPGCSLMSFALSLLWTDVLLNFPTPFLLTLAPWDWHHFSSHHPSPLESPTHC